MKHVLMVIGLMSCLMSLGAFASVETRTFYYDGSQNSVELLLQADQTHTEYRYETRYTMCYRQEVYYQTHCTMRPHGQRICQTIPYYRTISYPCMQTIQVPYEVKDFDVFAKVSLNVEHFSELSAAENFKITLNGDRLGLTAQGSKKFFILLKKDQISTQVRGSSKFIDASYNAELMPASSVMKSLSMTNIGLKNNLLSFKMGPVQDRDLVGFYLQVKKAPILGNSTVMFERELNTDEILLNTSENGAKADIDIQRLGVSLGSGRYALTAKAFFKYADRVINAQDFSSLEASRTLIFKNR